MITGGCLCGAVRYQTDGPPLVGLRCYCRDCQRASGSTGLPVMIVDKKQFKVTGKTGISAVTGGSGRKAIRHFCPDCGSLLFGTPEVAPEIVTVYVGGLDDPRYSNRPSPNSPATVPRGTSVAICRNLKPRPAPQTRKLRANARIGLQSHPCDEHHGYPVPHGGDEGIVARICAGSKTHDRRQNLHLIPERFCTTKTRRRH